jgi:predicted kinase
LVIVSGAPGGGKTTLANRLAGDLGLPLLIRDALKEALADAMGSAQDVEASQRLGAGAYAALYLTAAAVLDGGAGVVIESNFRRGLAEADLLPLLRRSRACLVHCTADRLVLAARYADRFARGERHSVHLDADRASALEQDLSAGRFEPLDLPVPILVVDTTSGWSPGYESVRGFAATAPGTSA